MSKKRNRNRKYKKIKRDVIDTIYVLITSYKD